jgi:N-acyl homoserine lactone hydrolase
MCESNWSKTVIPAISAHLAADLIADGEQMPVYVWTIDHPAGRVLVDTGLIDSRPEVEDMSPTPHPENIPRDVACVINTHLHYDHCGGNRLFPGVPIHVQARELADARSLDLYTVREWVDFDGATYVEHEGEVELLPGIRLGCQRPGTRTGTRASSSRRASVRSSSAATWRFGSASSTSRTPKDSYGCARSSPSLFGSRTSTSPGGRAPSKARRSAYGRGDL